MRRLVWLYPPRWRARYGAELGDMLQSLPMTASVVFDVVRSAGREHGREIRARLNKEGPMRLEPATRHPTASAILAVLLMAPTAALVAASIIGHELGVASVARAVDPVIEAVTAVGVVDLFLVAAPLLSLVAAVAPLLEVGIVRSSGGTLATFAVRLRWLNVAIALAALLLGVLLLGHHMTESLLEAAR